MIVQKNVGSDEIPQMNTYPCGSEPARESGGSVTLMLNVLPSSRAGSLPQGFLQVC
jgi:hypothetical protein